LDSSSRLRSQTFVLAAIAIVYWLMMRLGLAFVVRPEGIASIWPASGFALAVILLNPRPHWAKLLAVLFATNTIGNVVGGNSIQVSLGFAAPNILETWLCALVLAKAFKAGITFERSVEMLALFGVAFLVNGFTAIIGAFVSVLAFDAPFISTWQVWWSADGLGILLVTPLVVLWTASKDAKLPRRVIETIVLSLASICLTWLLFGPFTDANAPVLRGYMLLPLLALAAVRLSPRIITVLVLSISVIAIGFTTKGFGFFAVANLTDAAHLVAAQLFLAMSTFMSFLIVAIIADRTRAELSLKASRELYHDLYHKGAEGLITTTQDGHFVEANLAFARMHGYTIDEIEGIDISKLDVLKGATTAERADVMSRIQAGATVRFEAEHCHKDGHVFPVAVTTSMIHLNGTRYYISFHQDITEREKAVEALRRTSKELKIKSAEIERFLYTASHDLKSPVVTIQSFVRCLEQDIAAADTSSIEKDVKFIKAAADKMGYQLEELLEMSRVGRLVNVLSHVSVKALVNEAVTTVAGRIIDCGVTVSVADMEVALYCDRTRIAEVWQNLIENACKFMGDQKSPRIDIGMEQRGADTVFYVRDNGIGIAPRHHDRIFDLFERLDKHIEGTGMGLVIVKRIVELNQGRVWVESAGPGQGTTFCFTLPGAIKTEGKTA